VRARLAILLLVPLGCRGEFNIGQYLVGASESGEAESMDSGSTDIEPTDSESSDTDPTATETAETETTDTGATCTSIQLELADGCFGLLDSYELDVATTDLELADYTGDGQLDLLLAAAEFRIMLGMPGGMFADAVPITGTSGIAVAAGQLDMIPAADFAAIDTDQIRLRYSVGRGNFSDAGLIASGGFDAQFVDLDNNGLEDLVVSGLLLRTFYAPLPFTMGQELGHAGTNLVVTDLDGDEDFDVALVQPALSQLALFQCADGSLIEPIAIATAQPVDVAVGLLDDDDLPDVVVLGSSGLSLYEMLMPAFGVASVGFQTVGEDPRALDLGDIDGDGILDAVTANFASDDISILLGTGGTLANEARVPSQNPSDDPTAIALGDLDDDDRDEIIVIASGLNRVRVFGYID
jgi:hypothetical protein